MLSTLKEIIIKYNEIEEKLLDQEILSNISEYTRLNKEKSSMLELYNAAKKYVDNLNSIKDNDEIISDNSDQELTELAKEENDLITIENKSLEDELKILLIPKDPEDPLNAIIEIRPGAGGDESSLFGNEVYDMYKNYAESKGYKIEILELSNTDVGGIKELVALVTGLNAYQTFKWENGTHRVQRVPVTESGGRVHTSTITVAILPEINDDITVEVLDKDLKIDTYRSSGAGGQSVNTTDSAVRITHIPTGIIVTSQKERSQIKNREIALKVLKSKIYESHLEKRRLEEQSMRQQFIGTGERSEKIRTYNYPQNRVTDHRVPITVNRLEYVLQGNLDIIIDELIRISNEQKLSASMKYEKNN